MFHHLIVGRTLVSQRYTSFTGVSHRYIHLISASQTYIHIILNLVNKSDYSTTSVIVLLPAHDGAVVDFFIV